MFSVHCAKRQYVGVATKFEADEIMRYILMPTKGAFDVNNLLYFTSKDTNTIPSAIKTGILSW